MYVSTQAIPQIVTEYLTEVIFPKVPTPLGQFGLGFLLPYAGSAVETRLASMLPALTTLGIVDANGKIDMDKALEAANTAMTKTGGKVTVLGYTADTDDLATIYQIAKRHATNE